MNSDAFSIRRVSVQTASIGGASDGIAVSALPPTAWRTCWSVSGFIRATACRPASRRNGLAAQETRALLDVVEVVLVGPDDLVVLVPLAGDQHYVVGPGVGQDRFNRAAPVDVDGRLADPFGAEPAGDLVEDGARVFGPRVVAGDVDGVGPLLSGFGHPGALAAVPVSAAAEQDAQLAVGERLQCRKDVVQRVVGMRVVHQYRKGLPRPHRLEPAG